MSVIGNDGMADARQTIKALARDGSFNLPPGERLSIFPWPETDLPETDLPKTDIPETDLSTSHPVIVRISLGPRRIFPLLIRRAPLFRVVF